MRTSWHNNRKYRTVFAISHGLVASTVVRYLFKNLTVSFCCESTCTTITFSNSDLIYFNGGIATHNRCRRFVSAKRALCGYFIAKVYKIVFSFGNPLPYSRELKNGRDEDLKLISMTE